MSPPELSGYTPVSDVVCPVKIGFVHSLRDEFNLACLYSIACRLNHFIHFHKPLLFDKRLNYAVTAVTGTYIVAVVFYLAKKSKAVKLLNDLLSSLISVKTFVLTTIFIDGSIIIHNVDFRKAMAFTYFEVVRVVSRSNLNYTCTKFHIYIAILNYRDFTLCYRKPNCLPLKIGISLILGIYRYSCISKHCLRTGGGKFKEVGCARLPIFHNRVFDMPEMSCLFLVLNLSI